MTNICGKKVVREPCIYYLVWFKEKQVRALLDIGNKVNAISPAYIERLDLKIWKTNVAAQKIDSSTLETFGMVITDFQIENKGRKPRFFQEIFLVADNKFEVILGMSFL